MNRVGHKYGKSARRALDYHNMGAPQQNSIRTIRHSIGRTRNIVIAERRGPLKIATP